MSEFVTIDRATLEQLVGALEGVRLCTPPAQRPMVREAITAGRAALANAEPKKINLTNTATGSLPQRVESIFEAVDKEVAAGRLVRTGPLEWSKPK